MTISVAVAVEAQWRGASLETLKPIVTLPLLPDSTIDGLLTIGSVVPFKLTDGRTAELWCARTPTGRYTVEIRAESEACARIEADAPISSLVRLLDGKLYNFRINIEA